MIKIGIMGFGTVGSGVAEVIAMNGDKINTYLGEELQVSKILDLRDFPDSPFGNLVTHDAEEFFGDSEIKVVVETIGGARFAYDVTKRALSLGKSVVTSNKELVSTHGVELMQIAKDNGCTYLYEAAVGGGIPIIRPLNRDLSANKVVKIAGIVNGTTNYVLTKMRDDNMSYEDALKRAQEKGFAELNPSADVDGIDAQRKLSILSTICLEGLYVAPETINTTGISDVKLDDILFAEKIGCSIKLLAIYENNDAKPICYVAPHFVNHDNLLASVNGVFNAIMVEGNALGKSIFYGQGAGKLPTASAVVGDVVDACLHLKTNMHTPNWHIGDSSEPVTAEFDSIEVSAVVYASAGKIAELHEAFKGYETADVCDDSEASAVTVFGITHKALTDAVDTVDGAKWFHYMA